MKAALGHFIETWPATDKPKAILLGTRRTDPYSSMFVLTMSKNGA